MSDSEDSAIDECSSVSTVSTDPDCYPDLQTLIRLYENNIEDAHFYLSMRDRTEKNIALRKTQLAAAKKDKNYKLFTSVRESLRSLVRYYATLVKAMKDIVHNIYDLQDLIYNFLENEDGSDGDFDEFDW